MNDIQMAQIFLSLVIILPVVAFLICTWPGACKKGGLHLWADVKKSGGFVPEEGHPLGSCVWLKTEQTCQRCGEERVLDY